MHPQEADVDAKALMSEREIFLAAIQIDQPAQRAAFLESECRGQPNLKDRIERLIATRQSSAAFVLENAVIHSDDSDLRAAESNFKEENAETNVTPLSIDISQHPHIGRYKLLEEIGQGGMGTVYMAQQTQPVKRRVAVKIINPGMNSREVLARFEAERQALALMEHPNIASVFDGGTTDSGLPYFVMELVRGVPLTDFCQEKKLSLKERLKLFVDVCKAVQHAHQKGIIHRDLKPKNIMVTMHDDHPVVKVIDFGVAKALHQDLTDKTLFTRYTSMIGTPLYMSPEQAQMSGLDVDTRSDVYSLGVVLYELLTGTTPFDKETLSSIGIDGYRKLLSTVEPPRPSVRASTLKHSSRTVADDPRELDFHSIGHDIHRDLDWIVMKALEKDRERRYESAKAFADDVTRYLAGDAVEACPPTLGYRLQKYARRNRGLLVSTGLMIATLFGATGISLRYAWKAGEAATAANVAKNNAIAAQEQSDKHLQSALDAVDNLLKHTSNRELINAPRVQPILKEILRDSLVFYDEFNITESTTAKVRYRAALTKRELAELSGRLFENDICEQLFQEALEELYQIEPEFEGDTLFTQELAATEIQLAQIQLSPKRSLEEPESFLSKAYDRMLGLVNSYPDNYEYRDQLSWVVETLCRLYENHDQAESSERLVLETWEKYKIFCGIRTSNLLKSDADLVAKLWRKKLESIRINYLLKRLPGHVHVLVDAASFFEDYQLDEAIALNDEALEKTLDLLADYPDLDNGKWLARNVVRQRISLFKKLGDDAIKKDGLFYLAANLPGNKVAAHELVAGEMLQLEDPIAVLSKAIEDASDCPVYYVMRGRKFREQGQVQRAREDFDRYVDLDGSQQALEERAEFCLRWLKDYEQTIADYDAIISRQPDPNHPSIHYLYRRRSRAQLRAGYLEAAKADNQKAFDIRPIEPNGPWWIELDQILSIEDTEFHHWMLDHLEKLAEANDQVPRFLDLHFQLAIHLEAFEEAAKRLVELKDVSDEETRYRFWYYDALVAAYRGDVQRYRETCAGMLSEFRDSDNPYARYFSAWSCALRPDALDDYTELIRITEQLVEESPKSAQFQDGLGAIHFRAGHYELAEKHLSESLNQSEDANTSTAYARYFLAMTYHAGGEPTEALEQLRQANEICDSELAGEPSWFRKLTLTLLRNEAEEFVKAGHPAEQTKEEEPEAVTAG